MEIIKQPLGLYKANCYVLKEGAYAIIIDPGFHYKQIVDVVGGHQPLAVLLTHGHCDHVTALDDICQYYHIPAYLHPGDQPLLTLIRRRPSVYKKKIFTHCNDLLHGSIHIGPFRFIIHEVPGHSEGSVVIQWGNHLFTGDTVFKGAIGNSDNYNGNETQLRESLRYLMTLNLGLIVHPGHREDTVLRNEWDTMQKYLDLHR